MRSTRNHRFDRDGTIAFINDVSNATRRRLLNAVCVDTLVGVAARQWNMDRHDPK
jgi:hypothetical protein